MRRCPLKSPKRRNIQRTPEVPSVATRESVVASPTLVLVWSSDPEIMDALRGATEERLTEYAEIGMLRWLGLNSQAGAVAGTDIARECEALLSWDLWRTMVERGYQPKLPEPNVPARLQVLVVVDALDGQAKPPPLDQMLSETRRALKRRAELTPVLIWLGQKPDVLGQGLEKCWPRIRMEQVAAGGLQVGSEKVMEAVEHLIVALVTSDLVPTIDRLVKREAVEWLVMGASALLVNRRAEAYVHEAVVREILGALVRPVPETDRPRLVDEVADRARRVREALVEEGIAALKEVGWDATASGLAIQECTLSDRRLIEAAFGPYGHALRPGKVSWRDWVRQRVALLSALTEPFAPDPAIGEKLYEHYRRVSEGVEHWYGEKPRGAAPRIVEEYQNLQVFLGAFLDRGLPARTSLDSGLVRLLRERPLPTGVTAALLAVLGMENHLAGDLDLEDACGPSRQIVRAVPTKDDAYLRAAAEADADAIQGEVRRYAHFSRTLASPWGVLLNLLPGWFVATLALQSLLHWSEVKSLAIGGIALLVLGIGEMAYWWLLRARRLLGACQRYILHHLGSRALALMAGTLREYRYWLLHRLQESEAILTELYASLVRRYRQSEQAMQAINTRQSVARQSSLVLFDEEEASEWEARAIKDIVNHLFKGEEVVKEVLRSSGGGFAEVIAAWITSRIWPVPDTPAPSATFVEALDTACGQAVRESARRDLWRAGMIAEKLSPLSQGRRWQWLWQQAHPLGDTVSAESPFTIMLAPRDVLGGRTGEGSQYWNSDWKTALCRQADEEMCIRAIVEGKRGN